jgi:energy-converting hydrogenase Eha subunit E
MEGSMADEKDEKEEKERHEHEKDDEKREEKSPEEKWRRDPVGSVIWACILIWAGVVLMLNNAGTLVSLRDSLNLERLEAWSVILLGAGLILLGEIAVRLAMPVYRRPIVGTLILAVILIGAGVQQITNKDVVWALALIAIGIGLLFRGAFRGNRL